MKNLKKINLNEVFLFLYLFFLSFFNYTPFYIASGVILLFLTVLKIFKEKKVIFTSYFYFQIGFIVINLLYVVFNLSMNSADSINAIKTLCLNLSLSLCIMNNIKSKDDLTKVINWIVPIAIFACFFIIIYAGGGDGRLAHGYKRLFSSTTYTSMEIANWALYGSAICMFRYLKTRNKKNLLPMLLFWIVIFWSGSRKCLVLAVLLHVFVYLSNMKKSNLKYKINKKNIIKILGVMLSIFMVVFITLKIDFLYNLVGYRFVGFLDNTESSAVARNSFKDTAIKYIKMKPWTGYGLDTFREVSIYHSWTESNYLELAFSNGIIILLFYYVYMIYILISLHKIKKIHYSYSILFYIILMLIVFDVIVVSYIGRLENFFITISSLAIYLEKKERCLKNE